jgi:two-component system OmpR family sensor kinase
MWLRLVAGVAAHDINNATQGLINLLELAERPGTSRETLARYTALARESLAELGKIAATLSGLSLAGRDRRPIRLAQACSDAVAQMTVPEGQSLVLVPSSANVVVNGAHVSMQTVVSLLLRYIFASSPPGAAVRVQVVKDGGSGVVVCEGPTVADLPAPVETPLADILSRPERPLNFGGLLVLAAAIAAEQDGTIRVISAPGDGVRFKVAFPCAEEAASDGRRA